MERALASGGLNLPPGLNIYYGFFIHEPQLDRRRASHHAGISRAPPAQHAQARRLYPVAASLGLTPKQNSSGGKKRLLGISKRGDAYLRSLLVHGARAVIRTAQPKSDRLSTWAMRIATTRHPNIAAVALASKTARIA
jgi:transposase